VNLDAKDVRAWAVSESVSFGTRGQVSWEITTEYLYAHSAEARQLGLSVPMRGRVRYETCEQIARSR